LGVHCMIGPIDRKIYARPVYKALIMRRILVLMVATLALLQAWSVIGQEMQDPLNPNSELEATEVIIDFLNESDNDSLNDTLNETENAIPIDTNLSTTDSQNAFLDLPVNVSLIDTNLSTTDSQSAFLDLPVNASLIDTGLDLTDTQSEFLLDQPIDTPAPFYKKGQLMGTTTESNDSSASQATAFFKKHQMMGT